ncbi:gliding motility-associated C-terminal domain-containing protein [Mesonia phycicola]|uniref:Gliding motility-associated C-terminal domain-containing protein n=1 Tax=Mesonia phycicola TaxID=579105 RepID=A0A1M6DYT9_9FLAO|nr:T9SS type B sorting domain-containing protein [Mesonia phycicola]SHI78303.1 gliding motility-associated C-terminal domain-containing protein [Mesonia phycicola]
MKKILLILLLLPIAVFSQGEANYWYFGTNAGVNFNTSPPTSLNDGQLDTSEGCSSISDESGNLLFYTDGRTVWNRNHQIMSNANYFGNTGLLGDPSSTSSGLIVPHPTDSDIYYVFTVDEPHHDNADTYPSQGPGTSNGEYTDLPNSNVPDDDDGYNNGLNYSVVDMSLNGGLGDVISTEKNIHLITYDETDSEEIKYKCSEKITAVKGSDCNSIWVLTHFIDKFYAFKIDDTGVNTNPIISQTGPSIPISSYRRAALGYMKTSPDGKKILIAHNTKTYNQQGSDDAEDGGVYLYDFNDATGNVSNNLPLVENVNAYGVEFSMETQKAYATVTKNNSAFLYQWDLTSADIPNSIQSISGVSGSSATALQLAPNGKIYKPVISTAKLAVINNPELDASLVDYTESTIAGAINLGSNNAIFGLPPFIQSIFSSRVNIIDQNSEEIITNLSLCEGESFNLSYANNYTNATYTWYKDGVEITTANTESFTVNYDSSITTPYTQSYKLEIDINDGSCPLIGLANITYNPFPEISDISFNQCNYTSNDTSIFDLTNIELTASETGLSFQYYENLQDAENEINSIDNPSYYYNKSNPQIVIAKVSSEFCSSYAEISLTISNKTITAPIEINTCSINDTGFESFDLNEALDQINALNSLYNVSFYSSEEDAILMENAINNISNYQNTTSFQQTIYARVENGSLCEDIIPIILTVEDPIILSEDETIIYCLEDYPDEIELDTGIPTNQINDFTYYWEPTGETTPTISTNVIGNYSVTVTNIETGCEKIRLIDLEASNRAAFTTELDGLIGENKVSIILDESSIGVYEYSLDNQFFNYQDENYFINLTPGSHTIYVRDINGCGITSKEILVLGVMRFFTPNNDGINDTWHLLGRDATNTDGIEIYIFDRFGKLITSIDPDGKGWDGTYNGKNLPSNDYWYLIKFNNGKAYKNNFTLKR